MGTVKEWDGYYVENYEILNLIDAWNNADKDNRIKIQAEIIRKLTYMVQSRIKCYKNTTFYEDLLQEGRLAIIKALHDFDIERGQNFFMFLGWHISNYVNRYKRWLKRSGHHICPQEQNIFAESAQDQYLKKEIGKTLIKMISKLPKIDRQVLFMHYGINGYGKHTYEQIGILFSLSKQRIQQIECRAITRLQRFNDIKVIAE